MWNVRTVQLPNFEIQHNEYPDREAAWMGYLGAIEAAREHASTVEEDLVIGVDLHHEDELIEQHWITLSEGTIHTGKTS